MSAFDQVNNRIKLPPGVANQNNGQAHINPSGFRLGSAVQVVEAQKFNTVESSPYVSNYVAPGITAGVTNSQFTTDTLEAATNTSVSGYLRIDINDSHTIQVGDVVRISLLANADYSVIAVPNTSSFVINKTFNGDEVIGEFTVQIGNGEVPQIYDTQNIGRSGGVKPKRKGIRRVHSTNTTSLIRQGFWNPVSGVFVNNSNAVVVPSHSNTLASGFAGKDTATGHYQLNGRTQYRQGSGLTQMNYGGSGNIYQSSVYGFTR